MVQRTHLCFGHQSEPLSITSTCLLIDSTGWRHASRPCRKRCAATNLTLWGAMRDVPTGASLTRCKSWGMPPSAARRYHQVSLNLQIHGQRTNQSAATYRRFSSNRISRSEHRWELRLTAFHSRWRNRRRRDETSPALRHLRCGRDDAGPARQRRRCGGGHAPLVAGPPV